MSLNGAMVFYQVSIALKTTTDYEDILIQGNVINHMSTKHENHEVINSSA